MSEPTAEPEPAPNPAGRLPNGLFARGNKLAKGNAYARRMHALRKTLLECVSDDDIKTIVGKLFELAASGDCAAIKLYLEYTVGKPALAVELSGQDGEPLGITLSMIQAVILDAVGENPEARARAALALRALASAAREGAADD